MVAAMSRTFTGIGLLLPSLSNSFSCKARKNLRLKFQGKIADFVEKQRSLVRQFEAADLAVEGSRKCAPLMSKQFAFQQARGDRRAIQLHHHVIAAWAMLVNGARDDLLARSCLPQDQYGDVRRSDGFDEFQHALQANALPDDLLELGLGVQFLLEIAFLQLALPQCLFGLPFSERSRMTLSTTRPSASFYRPQHDVGREFASVLAPAVQLQTRSHRPGAGRRRVLLAVGRMRVAKPFRNEAARWAGRLIRLGVAKHAFHSGVHFRNPPLGVGRDDGVRRKLEQGAELRLAAAHGFLGPLVLGDVARHLRESEQLSSLVSNGGDDHIRPKS